MSIFDTLYDRYASALRRFKEKAEYARDARFQSQSAKWIPMTRVFWAAEYRRAVAALWEIKREIHRCRSEFKQALKLCGDSVRDHDREIENEAREAYDEVTA